MRQTLRRVAAPAAFPAAVLAAVLAALLLVLAGPVTAPARAQTLSSDLAPGGTTAAGQEQPTELLANEMVYERDLGLVTARGNVEVSQGERLLFADTVTYNERDEVVTASGNVVLREPTGDVLFAEHVELSDGLKRGVIQELKVLRADRSRLSARRAVRDGEKRTILERAVYTRCEACPDDPGRAPIWQIKAGKVTRDEEAEIVEYDDAMFEFFGVPVFYTPYFYHPDPAVDRKSGLLTPIIGSSSELGAELTLPLYLALTDTSDITLSPRMTSKEGLVMGTEYRQRFDSGKLDFGGSVTYVDQIDVNNVKTGAQEVRGHIKGTGRFDLGSGFTGGFDLYRASDDTYLKRYDIDSTDTLRSGLFLNGINGRRAASVEFLTFQGLRLNDNDGDTPIVMPLASFTAAGEPGFGGRMDGTLSGVALQRTGGRDTRRITMDTNWFGDHVGTFGDLMTFGLHLRGDAYMVSEAQLTDPTAVNDDDVTGRLLPSASLLWRLPMVRRDGRLMETMEPIVQVIAAPGGGNPSAIPNEDSQSFEFSEANLFERNRFVGFDRVETGSRINYGLRLGLHGESGGRTDLFIGQSLRLNGSTAAPVGSGLEDRLSDMVGRLTIAPSDLINYSFRFRFDVDGPTMEAHEHLLQAGDDRYKVRLAFLSQSPVAGGIAAGNTRELNTGASARIADNWTLFGSYRRDLTRGGGSIRAEGGLHYLDECFDFQIGAVRDFTSDRDIEESTSIFFRVQLRGLE